MGRLGKPEGLDPAWPALVVVLTSSHVGAELGSVHLSLVLSAEPGF